MNPEDQNPLPDELRHKFPDLRPVKKPPPLTTINGIGLSMYGRRDADEETGTYVKTHCVCLVFIPILALGAYRVADADRGWYFIGKEKLSGFARGWNIAILCLAILGGGWVAQNSYTSSPKFHAGQQLAKAAAALEAGNDLEAARLYKTVATGGARESEGRAGLQQALDRCLDSNSPETLQKAFELIDRLPANLQSPPLVPDAFDRGIKHVERIGTSDPDAALDLLAAVRLIDPTNAAARPLEVGYLTTVLAANPHRTNRAVELALIHEADQDWDACVRVLEPVRDGLDSTEGARILGQHLLRQGENEAAYALLRPYVEARLEQLRSVEQNYTNAVAASYRRALDHLNDGRAPKSFYTAYDQASEAEQEALVDGFISDWMERDAAYQRALEQLHAAGRIVHVTLDLGIVQLNRAQSLRDPAARKAELEAAEKTFLAIRGMAGDTDEYRLFLGQVYYWLGRLEEGRALFEELLAANERSYGTLMAVSSTLREVGEDSLARQFTEEAYATAQTDQERYGAASLRARTQKDTEDQIAWLEKSDPAAVDIQISLNAARGEKALSDGQRDLAADLLRKAIAGYERLPKNSASLNNCGLVYFDLYGVTGNLKDHDRGLALLDEAVAMEPGNSVLLVNTASQLIDRAYMDTVGDTIRFGVIKAAPDRTMLSHLYGNEQEREQVYQRLRANEHMKKGLAYLDKVMLLAPRNPSPYWMAVSQYGAFRDLDQLKQLQQRLQATSPDLDHILQSTRDAYAGVKDDERREQLEREIARHVALLTQPEVTGHPPTELFVKTELNGLRQGAFAVGLPTDTANLLAEARSLYRAHPGTGTRSRMISALLLRAHEQLSQANTQYAALAESTRRSLSPRYLMTQLILFDHPAVRPLREMPEFREAAALVQEGCARFPTSPDATDWVLLNAITPAEAERLRPAVAANEAGRLRDQLQGQLNPASVSAIVEEACVRQFTGDAAGARDVCEQAIKDGLPLPPPWR